MRAALVAIVVVGMSSGAMAADWTSWSKPGDGSRFNFRGNEIGDPIARMEALFWNPASSALQCYTDRRVPGFKTCRDASIDGITGQSRIEDVLVKQLFYEYLDDRLIGFLVTAAADQYGALKSLAARLYGPPHREEISSLQGRDGGLFDQAVSIWNTPHGPMTLTKRARATNEAVLRLLDTTAARKLALMSRDKAPAASGSSE